MTNNNIHQKSNSTTNNGRSKNKIKLTMYAGVLGGNIITPPPPPPPALECEPYSLDFSCPENSEYVGVI